MSGFSDDRQAWPDKDKYRAALNLQQRFGSAAIFVARRKEKDACENRSVMCSREWGEVIAILVTIEGLALAAREMYEGKCQPSGKVENAAETLLKDPSRFYRQMLSLAVKESGVPDGAVLRSF